MPLDIDEAELTKRIENMSPSARREIEKKLSSRFKKRKWTPQEGPQTAAYVSQADVMLYGGAAGGGKSDLLLGLAFDRHKASRIFRKKYVELKGLEDRLIEINGGRDGYAASPTPRLDLGNGHTIEFGAMLNPGDEEDYQGRARDFMGFDEAAQFLEYQVEFVLGWNRSAEGLRCRAVLASNPPTTAEGEWLIKWFAPWIDDEFEGTRAAPGELRWALHTGGDIIWVEGPGVYDVVDGKWTKIAEQGALRPTGTMNEPRSYTFIPAKLDDNAFLRDTGYRKQIMAMPEPLRSKMLYGDFSKIREDDPMQVIPTEWILGAQSRWDPDGWRREKMTDLGVDVAQGGPDKTVLVPRHDWWFNKPIIRPGASTPTGDEIVELVVQNLRQGAASKIDTGGGYGLDAFNQLRKLGIAVAGLNGSTSAGDKNDRSGQLRFRNRRAEWWWGLREALDPVLGAGLALPPGREVIADLAAPRYSVQGGQILVESKLDIRKRLGRSPDIGDAIVYAYAPAHVINANRIAGRQHSTVATGGRLHQRRIQHGANREPVRPRLFGRQSLR